jgi:hypothetical protein
MKDLLKVIAYQFDQMLRFMNKIKTVMILFIVILSVLCLEGYRNIFSDLQNEYFLRSLDIHANKLSSEIIFKLLNYIHVYSENKNMPICHITYDLIDFTFHKNINRNKENFTLGNEKFLIDDINLIKQNFLKFFHIHHTIKKNKQNNISIYNIKF